MNVNVDIKNKKLDICWRKKFFQLSRLEYKTSEEAIEISFDDLKEKSDESVWCKNYFSPTNSPNLNFTLHHPLFGVFTKLLPGLIYRETKEQQQQEQQQQEQQQQEQRKDEYVKDGSYPEQ
ncbi:hypothetical protein RUM43_013585 [Polyplax serrata]|uniref:Uncharacterized protein n=1 Tax=Polyplax serrata TaxID=468196 RepID=A0AAN8PI73_POLSC